MRVLLVGTVPPPGGSAARAFAREAARRDASGEAVEVLSPHPLSSAHRNANLRGGRLRRQLRALANEFDAVELRIDAALALDSRSARALQRALARFDEVTYFVDTPIPIRDVAGAAWTAAFWAAANSIIVANEHDRALIAADGVPAGAIEVVPRLTETSARSTNWPDAGEVSLREGILGAVKSRALAEGGTPGGQSTSMLVSATTRVHPSLKGSTVWLIRRVVGKTRGAVTKILRPTPKHPKPTP